jgi:antitoxin component YwqK of YwqJK toxin-antitoxin module
MTKLDIKTEKNYYPNGELSSESNIKDNELHGLQTSWYVNGNKALVENYEMGYAVGPYTEWYENGQKKIEGTYAKYSSGLKSGRLDKGGKIIDNYGYHYINGVKDGISKEWYEDGQEKLIEYIENGLRNGEYIEWYENGQQKIIANYKNGFVYGKFKEWYENGQLKMQAIYKDGYDVLNIETHKFISDEKWFSKDGKPFKSFYELNKHEAYSKIDITKAIKDQLRVKGIVDIDTYNEQIDKTLSFFKEAYNLHYIEKHVFDEAKKKLKDLKV